MAKRGKKQAQASGLGVFKYLGWALLAGTWVLALAALISYDAADWPNRDLAPHNPEVHNWVGVVGAAVAYKLVLIVGPGVWVTVAGVLAFLVATARGRDVTHPVVRAIEVPTGNSNSVSLKLPGTINWSFSAAMVLPMRGIRWRWMMTHGPSRSCSTRMSSAPSAAGSST